MCTRYNGNIAFLVNFFPITDVITAIIAGFLPYQLNYRVIIQYTANRLSNLAFTYGFDCSQDTGLRMNSKRAIAVVPRLADIIRS